MNSWSRATWALAALVICGTSLVAPAAAGEKPGVSPSSIYDITVKDIDGKDVALSKYKGKALLIVNVASK